MCLFGFDFFGQPQTMPLVFRGRTDQVIYDWLKASLLREDYLSLDRNWVG